jgi:hypothetical protein
VRNPGYTLRQGCHRSRFLVAALLLRNLPRGGGLRSEDIAISGGLMFQPTEDALLVLAFIFLGT